MKLTNKILSVLLDALFIIIIMFTIKLNIVPTNYLIIFITSLVILGIVITTFSFKYKRKLLGIVLIILSLLFSSVSIFGISYLYSTDKFLSSIKDVNEKSIFYIVVNKDDSYLKLEDLENKTLGIFDTKSKYYQKAIKSIEDEIVITEKQYSKDENIITDLYDKKVDSILINSNTYDIFNETYSDFSSKTKVIKEITVNMDKNINTDNSYDKPFSLFISGIDTYGDINTTSRSDVNIVVTVNSKTGKMLLTSIPRDYYVTLYEFEELDKLTHAGIYGIDTSVGTVENLLETEIKYYVRVNFDTLIKMVDSIGGVTVKSDQAFTAGGYYFKKGKNHLDGKKALAYSRERYSFKEGDRKRGKHQEQIIEAIVKKITSSKVLLKDYPKILKRLSDSIETNITNDMIKYYVKDELESMKKYNIKSISLDGTGRLDYTYSMPSMKLYVMVPDRNTVSNAKISINNVLNDEK